MLESMSLEQQSQLIADLEKRLGRQLTASENRLMLLAEEIMHGSAGDDLEPIADATTSGS